MISIPEAPNWIVTTIMGAILGALFSDYRMIALYPFRRFKKSQFIGIWHEYHWTWKSGTKCMTHAQFEIRRGILAPYAVVFFHVSGQPAEHEKNHPSGLRYKGGLRLEEGHVIIDMHATTHTESVSYRFPKWIPSSSDFVVGLWMSYDHSGVPAAGGTLLTKDAVNDSVAAQYLHDQLESSDGLLRIGNASSHHRRNPSASAR